MLLECRMTLAETYNMSIKPGVGLLWTIPWDRQVTQRELNPSFIGLNRRMRLVERVSDNCSGSHASASDQGQEGNAQGRC